MPTPEFSARPSHAASRPPAIKVTSLSGLISLTPYLVGFTPTESLVLVFTGGQPSTIKVTVRLDLLTAADWREHGEAVVAHVATAIDRARSTGVPLATAHLLVFSQDAAELPAAPLIEAIADVCRVRCIDVGGAVAVGEDVCWYYDCPEVICCPGGPGHRLDDADALRATFAMVSAGVGFAPSREALEEAVSAPRGGAARITARELQEVRRRQRSSMADPLAASVWRRAQEDAIVAAADRPCDPDEVRDHGPAWTLALADSRVREPVLRRLLLEGSVGQRQERMSRSREWLTALVRLLDGPECAPVAATVAALAWQQGDGAVARIAAERALSADADNRLAALISTACSSGLPPSTWTDVLCQFTLAELRHPVGAESLAS